ncbi:DoxX family membrane protein [Pontimonas sp.]|uniref:DoxX family protein n=1 Tax=Pontimonas sp. TaxID=2304492 RepID=UPI0028701438|nr:DoxX family membrane protein [Pontimonas sp.]MDR9395878.1 DoxX family membrane protein [Pontimonas sp.]MDR9434586.1 DoxX family membrane protein [Pontimonas sp.]
MNSARIIARIVLGAALIFAGLGHLTFGRAEFQAQVPPWLPFEADFVVVASGVVEITLGVLLVVARRYRRQVGWVTAAFFVVIFPGNVSQYLSETDAFGLNSDTARFTRLFFQPLLILWALWATNALARKTTHKAPGPTA